MKEIVSQYGRAFVAIMIAGIILMAMGGIRSGVELAKLYHGSNAVFTETDAFLKFRSREGITASYLTDNPIVAKEKVVIANHFAGKNSLGETVQLNLIYVESDSGQTIGPQEGITGQWVEIENPGVYTFYFEGTDANGNICEIHIAVPVQSKLPQEAAISRRPTEESI